MILKTQLIIYIVISILLGLIFNFTREFYNEPGIPLFASDLEIINDVEEAFAILSEPQIREIDLKTAREFHQKELLFVDARAEEYLFEGRIPGAIANDDSELLADQIFNLNGYEKGFVVYCSDDDCGSSEELAYELKENGFMNIFVFKGGWKEWIDSGMEVEVK